MPSIENVYGRRARDGMCGERIAVLKVGRVLGQGSHDARSARDGEYARLYRLQFADAA